MILRKTVSISTNTIALLGLMNFAMAPVQAALYSLEFDFNDIETKEAVKGRFIFNNAVAPTGTDFGSLYEGANLSFEVIVGDKVFTGFNKSMAVADNFIDVRGVITDVVLFGELDNFDPNKPLEGQSLASFQYSQDTWESENLPPEIRSTGIVRLKLDDKLEVYSPNAFTSIKALEEPPKNIPEPNSLLSIVALGTLGVITKRRYR